MVRKSRDKRKKSRCEIEKKEIEMRKEKGKVGRKIKMTFKGRMGAN